VKNLNVFSYNTKEIVKEISKKGTESDIALYNRKDDNGIMTILEPSRYPEKISSLTDSLFPADMCIIGVSKIDRELGEVIVAADLMGKRKVIFVPYGDVDRTLLKKIISSTGMDDYLIFDGSPMDLVSAAWGMKINRENGGTEIIVDHSFVVKSVGTVALGFVIRGNVKKHQELYVSESARKAQVRSIQMQDEDQESADTGSRVGLALKNADTDEVTRGTVMSDTEIRMSGKFEGEITFHSSIRNRPAGRTEIFVSDLMRFQRGFYENSEIILDSAIPVVKEQAVLSSQVMTPRVFGKIRIR
jgi:selenocysteine-specific translation elongation factor